MSVIKIHWVAKINYNDSENYKSPELMQIGRALVKDVPGIKCTWIHPRIESRYLYYYFGPWGIPTDLPGVYLIFLLTALV